MADVLEMQQSHIQHSVTLTLKEMHAYIASGKKFEGKFGGSGGCRCARAGLESGLEFLGVDSEADLKKIVKSCTRT
jgi:hypothetical protein